VAKVVTRILRVGADSALALVGQPPPGNTTRRHAALVHAGGAVDAHDEPALHEAVGVLGQPALDGPLAGQQQAGQLRQGEQAEVGEREQHGHLLLLWREARLARLLLGHWGSPFALRIVVCALPAAQRALLPQPAPPPRQWRDTVAAAFAATVAATGKGVRLNGWPPRTARRPVASAGCRPCAPRTPPRCAPASSALKPAA